MQATAQQVIDYLSATPILSLGLAFVAGFAAIKSVASDTGVGIVGCVLIGALGLFLSQFVLLSTGLLQYLETISEFRLLVDLAAAYIGAFVIAAMIHFVKPI